MTPPPYPKAGWATQVGEGLTQDDYASLSARWVDADLANAAQIRRVDSATGAEHVGRRDAKPYEGLLIPYFLPGDTHVREWRLRRDRPEIEHRSGVRREVSKYLSPPGRRNMLYFPPGIVGEELDDPRLPIIITEGEFKALALTRLARHESDTKRFLPIAIPGVWNWKGTIGKAVGPKGDRRDEVGPISDLLRINWQGRKVIIAFDSDSAGNQSVQAARAQLARELRSRGAHTAFFDWPAEWGKGIDDALATRGPGEILRLIGELTYRDPKGWREKLLRNANDVPKANLHNAVVALREAPELAGMLQFDQFAQKISITRPSPWGYEGPWSDCQDVEVTCWLQKLGIDVQRLIAADAVRTVAGDNAVDPLHHYLESLVWDGVPRIDSWLSTYLGTEETEYTKIVGARWLISGAARGLEAGCKADACLVLEGRQGIGKSRALRILGGSWFTDQLPDLRSKDAMLQLQGIWIVEISELDSLSRSEVSTVKGFLSASIDRFRPPYQRNAQDVPRRCVFAGTSNKDDWHRDETGGRRFWPVECHRIDIEGLRAVRDQLWAEAVHRYKAGECWWLEGEVARIAAEETAKRLSEDPWEESIAQYVDERETVSIADILRGAIDSKEQGWTPNDRTRVARILATLGWKRVQVREPGRRRWTYRRVTSVTTSRIADGDTVNA